MCCEIGVSESTFYRWRRKFDGIGVAELRRLKALKKENTRLKQLVADLTAYSGVPGHLFWSKPATDSGLKPAA